MWTAYADQITCCLTPPEPTQGCTNAADNSGNYLGDDMMAAAAAGTLEVEDDGSCVFQYCFFDPDDQTGSPNPDNWACFDPVLAPLICIEPELTTADFEHSPCGTTVTFDDNATTGIFANPTLCSEYHNDWTSVVQTGQEPGTFTNTDCEYAAVGCLDPGGFLSWNIDGETVGPFTDGLINSVVTTGWANNYDSLMFADSDVEGFIDPIPCNGGNSSEACVAGPDGIMQQVTDPDAAGYNPYGCCCEYRLC